MSSEQKAKAVKDKLKQAAKEEAKKEGGTNAGTPAAKPAKGKGGGIVAGKGKTAAPPPADKGHDRGKHEQDKSSKAQGKGKGEVSTPLPASDAGSEPPSDSDSNSGSDEQGLDMTRRADPEDDEFESDSGSDADEINVTFDTFNPVEDDFHGIKMFMTNLLDEQTFDSSGLVDLVLAQSGEVGTVVKIMDEEEVYGFLTVVNMNPPSPQATLKQIGDFILQKSPASQKDTFAKAMRGKTGLVVSERMINVPPELALPLLDGLINELAEANSDPVSLSSPIPPHLFLRARGRGGASVPPLLQPLCCCVQLEVPNSVLWTPPQSRHCHL